MDKTLALRLGDADEHHALESNTTGLNVKGNLYLNLYLYILHLLVYISNRILANLSLTYGNAANGFRVFNTMIHVNKLIFISTVVVTLLAGIWHITLLNQLDVSPLN